jgi:hypothetical protein
VFYFSGPRDDSVFHCHFASLQFSPFCNKISHKCIVLFTKLKSLRCTLPWNQITVLIQQQNILDVNGKQQQKQNRLLNMPIHCAIIHDFKERLYVQLENFLKIPKMASRCHLYGRYRWPTQHFDLWLNSFIHKLITVTHNWMQNKDDNIFNFYSFSYKIIPVKTTETSLQ